MSVAFGCVGSPKGSILGSSPPVSTKASHRRTCSGASAGIGGSTTGTPPARATASQYAIATVARGLPGCGSVRSAVIPTTGGPLPVRHGAAGAGAAPDDAPPALAPLPLCRQSAGPFRCTIASSTPQPRTQ